MEKMFLATISKVTKDHVIKSNSIKKVACILDDDSYVSIEGDEPEYLCYINEDGKNIDEEKDYMISVKECTKSNIDTANYLELLKKAIEIRQILNNQKNFERKINKVYK